MAGQSENRRYEMVKNPEDETWPIVLVLDGVPVAQFREPELANVVRGTLNSEYFPSRLQRVARLIASGGMSGLYEEPKPPVTPPMPERLKLELPHEPEEQTLI